MSKSAPLLRLPEDSISENSEEISSKSENLNFKNYYGCFQSIPQLNSYLSSLKFPLAEERSYSIGRSESCDLMLPNTRINGVIKIVVLKNEKVEIENHSNMTLFVNSSLKITELKQTEKCVMLDKCHVIFDDYCFSFTRFKIPSVTHWEQLWSSLQCACCKIVALEPMVLRKCGHVICSDCSTSPFITTDDMDDVITPLIASTSSQYNLFGMDERGRTIVPQQTRPRIKCPKCFTVESDDQALKKNVPLGRVAKVLDGISKDRPVCGQCDNQRWLVHGSEYVHCEDCEQTLCPLCALDSHRDHALTRERDVDNSVNRQLEKQYLELKRQWLDIMKSVDVAKNKSQKALSDLETFFQPTCSTAAQLTGNCKLIGLDYDKLVAMETPVWTEAAEKERGVFLENFEKIVDAFAPEVDKFSKQVEQKSSFMENLEKQMKKVKLSISADLKSEECSSLSEEYPEADGSHKNS